MDKIKPDTPKVSDLSLAERRFARRVIIATALGLAASTALFINRPYVLLSAAGASAHAAIGTAPAVSDTRRRLAPARPARIARSRLARAPERAPAGTRHRLIAASGPIDDDNPFAAPAASRDLYALHGAPPRMQGLGSLYRLHPAHSYFLPQTHLALSDRLPLVLLKPAPVPEPRTWVTLIAGLGLAGALLRRNRPAMA